jgi:NADH pyrophosphatase NudC (nudix superfamily)
LRENQVFVVIIAITCIVAVAVIAFVLGVRRKDLPVPEPESPFQHLDERKAAIYENLRDLQFEYRLGKLSDADYQHTKKDLQKELTTVLADVDKLKAQLGMNGAAPPAAARPQSPAKPDAASVCPSCGAKFKENLKFCGECGKPMKVGSQS